MFPFFQNKQLMMIWDKKIISNISNSLKFRLSKENRKKSNNAIFPPKMAIFSNYKLRNNKKYWDSIQNKFVSSFLVYNASLRPNLKCLRQCPFHYMNLHSRFIYRIILGSMSKMFLFVMYYW